LAFVAVVPARDQRRAKPVLDQGGHGLSPVGRQIEALEGCGHDLRRGGFELEQPARASLSNISWAR
jgi:hypothetical protein